MKEFKFLVGGKWKSSKLKEPNINPYTGESIGEVCQADEMDFEEAVISAQEGFQAMKKLHRFERADLLRRIAQGIQERKKELSERIAQEAGKPTTFAEVEVERSAFVFSLAAEEATRVGGEVIPMDLAPQAIGRYAHTCRFPIGPIAAICPFNFPLSLAAHKVAPALASGNSIVLKPPPQAPTTALLLGEIILEGGAPAGAFNVIPCPNSVAERLATDERFKMLSFTGSPQVGWHLKNKAGKKKVILELGGNAGAIVHSDADLDWATKRLAVGGYYYAGQVCISVQRIYVHEPIYKEFEKQYIQEVERLAVGDPMNSKTIVGPMIDDKSANRVESWVKEAQREGAQILLGGKREGQILEPIILTHVKREMKVNRLEVFGPVTLLQSYRDFEEALVLVNDTEFGLQAGVFTQDIRRIYQAFETIEVGGLMINDYPTYRIDHMPYGGVKGSGLGREGVKYALQEMTEPRLMIMNLATR